MALMLIFLRHIDQERVGENLMAFKAIDCGNSGQLDKEEMSLAIQSLRLSVPSLDFTAADIDAAYEKLDLDHTGLLTYSQFLIATLNQELLVDEQLIENLFKELDCFREGFLTKQSFSVALQRTIYQVS